MSIIMTCNRLACIKLFEKLCFSIDIVLNLVFFYITMHDYSNHITMVS